MRSFHSIAFWNKSVLRLFTEVCKTFFELLFGTGLSRLQVMLSGESISRREFLGASALAFAAVSLGAAETSARRPERSKIVGFIKPFQTRPFDEVADIVREGGWSGIEC